MCGKFILAREQAGRGDKDSLRDDGKKAIHGHENVQSGRTFPSDHQQLHKGSRSKIWRCASEKKERKYVNADDVV